MVCLKNLFKNNNNNTFTNSLDTDQALYFPAGKELIRFSDYLVGKPVTVSCAYTGRIAVAYKVGESFRRKKQSDANSRFCNLYVAIYECESSGNPILTPSCKVEYSSQLHATIIVWMDGICGPCWDKTWPRDYKTYFPAQLSTKFTLLINAKMPTVVGILTFISRINTAFESSNFKGKKSLYFSAFSFY